MGDARSAGLSSFAHQVVCEFLKRKKYFATLKTFDTERKSAAAAAQRLVVPAAAAPKVDSWYELSHALDVPDIHQYNVSNGGSGEDTLLESFLRFLVDVRQQKVGGFSASSPGRSPGPVVSIADGKRTKKAARPLEPVEEARMVMKKHGGLRSLHGGGTHKSLIGLEEFAVDLQPSPSQRRRMQKEREERRRAKLRGRGLPGQGTPRSASVGELQKRMDRGQRRNDKQRVLRGNSRQQREEKSGHRGAGGKAHHHRSIGSASGENAGTASAGASSGTAAAAAMAVAGRSNESWIPFVARMDMLRRDLAVAKVNIEQYVRWDEELSRSQPMSTELERAKKLAAYNQKKEQHCALCAKHFELINLPFNISYKAVMDLRRSWGVQIPPNPLMSRVPRCYDQVSVCIMCSQYFEDAEAYRPPAMAERRSPSEAAMLEHSGRVGPGARSGGYTTFPGMSGHRSNKDGSRVNVQIVSAGDGQNYPRRGSTVTIHYTGFLKDGTHFDSSLDRGKPFVFTVGSEQVLKGLEEGIVQLSKGEKALLEVPALKGYGKAGFPGLIPPNSTLIFQVELLSFVGALRTK